MSNSDTVRPNKVAVVFLMSLMTVVGLAPYSFFVGRPWLLIFFGLAGVGLSVASVYAFKTPATVPPTKLEFLLGSLGALRYPAGVGFMGYVYYWITYAGWWVLSHGAGFLGWNFQVSTESVAYYVSVVFTAMFALPSFYLGAEKLAGQLYPQTAGVGSAFYSLAQGHQRIILVGAILLVPAVFILVALVIILTPVTITSWWLNGLLLLLLSGLSTPFGEIGEGSLTIERGKAIDAVKKLIEAQGFEIFVNPRTGKEEIDPLLSGTDLYVVGPKRAFAVGVVANGPTLEDPDSPDPSDLVAAARALTILNEEHGAEMGRPVEPMFVVVGDDTSEVLATYGRNVARVSRLLAPKLVDRILKAQDPELLQQLGELHLNLTDAKQFDERLTNSKEGGVSGVLD